MNIKQNRQLKVILLIAFVCTGIVILLVGNSSKSVSSDFDSGLRNDLSSCNKIVPDYIGISESQAENKAIKDKRSYRTVVRDGESFMVTEDYAPGRLNFEVQKGVITKATCG